MGSKLKYKIKFIFDWRVKLRRKNNWVKGLKKIKTMRIEIEIKIKTNY
jgi:hypothetical protein